MLSDFVSGNVEREFREKVLRGLAIMAEDRLTRQQKKELGILPVQVLAHMRDADITKDMTSREKAFAYAAYASDKDEYVLAWAGIENGTYGVDWDAIIVFLEKLFELLARFLPLFI